MMSAAVRSVVLGAWSRGLSGAALDFDFVNGRGFNSIDRAKLTPDSILTYTAPSPKWVYNAAGLLVQSSGQLPYDYDPVTHAALGVLIEEQRTNLLLMSQEFNNTGSWVVPAGATIAADNITAPDGTLTADKLTRAATSGVALGYGNMGNGLALTAGVHTLSYFAKADTQTSFTVALVTGGKALGSEVVFNLSAGTAGAITNYGGTTGSVATIQELNGGWYRCSLTVTVTTATWFMQAEMPSAGAYWLWGAQLEAGAFATSYIPTVASQGTRFADQVSILTSAFAFSATVGTFIAEGHGPGSAAIYTLVGGASGLPQVGFNSGALASSIRAVVDLAQVVGGNLSPTVQKVGFAYQSGNSALVTNGGTVATDADAFTLSTGNLGIGYDALAASYRLNGHIKRLTYFPVRKTNAELQVLSR